MLFTDTLFLFYFLPIAIIIHRLAVLRSNKKYGNLPRIVLLLLTITFYGFEFPWWLLPFGISIIVDYTLALLISREKRPKVRKFLLCISVFQLVSILGIFKYWNSISGNISHLIPFLSEWLPQITINDRLLPLPAGVSFYIFESLSFVIDVYRKKVEAPRNPLKFFAFIAMFPRFIAGPIVRYPDMKAQIERYQGMQLEKGLYLFAIGFFLKTCFADQFALFAKLAFGNDMVLGFANTWTGVFAFAMQLYFDFSGYSLMAIGLGLCLGFQFPTNFNRPYLALSVADFWRRWHITLGTWVRDYVFNPLSLSAVRKNPLLIYPVLFLTMVIIGVWHGSQWTKLIMGAWFGFFLCLEHAWPFRKRLNRPLNQALTFLIVMVGWVFFKVNGMAQAMTVLKTMFNPFQSATPLNIEFILHHPMSIVLCIVGIVFCFFIEKHINYEELGLPFKISWKVRAGVTAVFLFSMIIAFSGNKLPFLYFQF